MEPAKRKAVLILAAFVAIFGALCAYFLLVMTGSIYVVSLRVPQDTAWVWVLLSGSFMLFALALLVLIAGGRMRPPASKAPPSGQLR